MRRAVLLAACAASALALAACQKKETAAPEAAPPEAATAPSAAAPAAAADATQTATAQDAAAGPIDPVPPEAAAATPAAATGSGATEATETVINGVALTDLYQLQAGKIAEAKAQSPAVKDFAKMMVADHTTMTNQMKHVFAALKVKVPTELGPRGARMIDALNTASPADFDKVYLKPARGRPWRPNLPC